MRVALSPESRVLVDLQATGLLKSVAHDPTLTARPEAATLDLDGPLVVRFAAAAIEVPRDISVSDQERMADNLLGRDVLDAERFPHLELRGRYEGDMERGTLTGDLVVRGQPHRVVFGLAAKASGNDLVVTGAWEGTLGQLGIRPFKALFGALKLRDWIRLRIDARLRSLSTSSP